MGHRKNRMGVAEETGRTAVKDASAKCHETQGA
jgi:hypothetical protein